MEVDLEGGMRQVVRCFENAEEKVSDNRLPFALGAIGTVGACAGVWLLSPFYFLGGACSAFSAVILWKGIPAQGSSPARSVTISDMISYFPHTYRKVCVCMRSKQSAEHNLLDQSDETAVLLTAKSFQNDQSKTETPTDKGKNATDPTHSEEDQGWRILDSNIPTDNTRQ